MQALQETSAASALDPAFAGSTDWILVVHATTASRPTAVRGYANDGVAAPRELDPRALRRRPPRAVVIDARDRGADVQGVVRFLIEAGIAGTAPAILAAPADVVGELDDVAVDDFVVVPYTTAEIAARIRRVERRWRARASDGRILVGALDIDTAAHRVEVDERAIALTRLEYALLLFFAHNPGRVFTRDELLTRVWGSGGPAGGRTVDIHVRRLRAKLGHGIAPLETVRGVGYRFMGKSPVGSAARLDGALAGLGEAHALQ